jgi:hypothetical protein
MFKKFLKIIFFYTQSCIFYCYNHLFWYFLFLINMYCALIVIFLIWDFLIWLILIHGLIIWCVWCLIIRLLIFLAFNLLNFLLIFNHAKRNLYKTFASKFQGITYHIHQNLFYSFWITVYFLRNIFIYEAF